MYKGATAEIPVYPHTKWALTNEKRQEKPAKNYQCPCKIFKASAIINRLFGRFAYSWKHVDGSCVYQISLPWLIYSFILMATLGISSKYIIPSLKFNISNLPVFLDSLTNLLNMVFVGLTVLHLFNLKAWIRFVNSLNRLNRDYMFCQQSKKMANNFQKRFMVLLCFMFLGQNAAFLLLKYTSAYELSLQILFFRNLNIFPIASYLIWFSCIRYCTSMFVCFENVVIHYLGYKHVHPTKDIEFTHNSYEFGGFSNGRTVCDESHYMPEHLKKLTRAEIVEYLRIRHEEMYRTVLLLQNLTSPQLLIYFIIEVSTNIVCWYSIVAYLIYKFNSPTANSTFILNCIYVVWHGTGIYWFFQNIHMLKKIVQGLKPILMTCVLTAQSTEEHQQLRIFINKIVYQQPITVNDFFEVDLGVIGPVVGNILTYVLVALQFEIPPQEQN